MKDIIELKIPNKKEYISTLRLTASSLANTIGMSIDDIEDIKVAISEAAIKALGEDEVKVRFDIDEDKFIMTVYNVVENSNTEDVDLGILIIKSLMDEVNFNKEGVEIIKNIEDDLR